VDFSYYLFGERTTIHGAGVQSVLAGKTAAAIAGSYPFGNFVIIETPHEALPDELVEELAIPPGESLYLLYAHLEEAPQISLGEFIPPCYPLGSVGKSGNAGVSHLHLEARKGAPGAVFPVMSYYLQESTPEEKEYYLLWRTSEKYQHFNPMDLLLFERGNEG
jgi:murein DD-endopeptidase MepM/ murein hydrolase activator NlpD